MNRDNLDFGSGKIGSLFKAMFFRVKPKCRCIC